MGYRAMSTTPNALDVAFARLSCGNDAKPALSGSSALDIAFNKITTKPAAQPVLTPEQERGRTLSNMALAMSGQQAQMAPEDREEFESGRKAGMTSAAVTA